MGGFVCQEFAIRFPERVMGMALLGTTPFGHVYYRGWERWLLTKAGAMAGWYPYRYLVHSIARNASRTDAAYQNLKAAVSKLSKKEIQRSMDAAAISSSARRFASTARCCPARRARHHRVGEKVQPRLDGRTRR